MTLQTRPSTALRAGLVAAVLMVAVPSNRAGAQGTAVIVNPRDAAPPIAFGVDALRSALTAKGISVRVATDRSGAAGDVVVVVGTGGQFSGAGSRAPAKPESYAVTLSADRHTISVDGSDATGAMYGALDVAEQLGARQPGNGLGEVKPVTKSPYLEVRGINMFLTVQDIDTPEGGFWSDEYWKNYLDMMARNRYNLLDIHALCDAVTLTFPNGFAHFVSLPDYPEVGVGAEKAARNMARFRQVIQMAADRGIQVGYMNYEAPPPIGPWKTRTLGVDERWARVPQDFLNGPRLEDYTRKAVTSFLKQLPGLAMFGFRVGESGQPEDFYKKTYLVALAEAPPALKVYLRTWIADPEKVRDLAASMKHTLYIEPKYNGEQLGTPYQGTLGGRQYPPSGSFENYTNKPQNFRILWQIRAHGTHRVFYWGSPDFVRRTVRSAKFGDGVGFSMEAMEAYMPAADYLHNNPKTDHSFYHWMVDRQWVWHMMWGRSAYDPDVPEQVFESEFVRRFGENAGPVAYRALVEASKIIPFIYQYHSLGMDHQEYAPEFENGDHAFGVRLRLWQGERLAPYGGNNDDFLRVDAFDRTAMASPATYVDNRLKGVVTGKMTPFEAAEFLDAAAAKSEATIERAASLSPSSLKNFECIRMDIQALAWLARYYRDRITSATHFAFYERTTHHAELSLAHRYLKRAAEDWDRLSDVTEQHFGAVPEYIRMGEKAFRWRDEGRGLGVDLAQMDDLETAFRALPTKPDNVATIGHVPPPKGEPGKPLELVATFATPRDEPHVYVFFRNSRQAAFEKLELQPTSEPAERTWKIMIPAEQMVAGYVEYYFGAYSGRWGVYDETVAHQPPFRVLVNANNTKPTFSYTAPSGELRGPTVNLTVKVDARAKLKSVAVYYKLMPSYYEFVRLEMQLAPDGRFTAAVPLTPDGILYYFEAVDEDGNAANYPDFLVQTPYLVIDSYPPPAGARTTRR